jgi:enoyl-CoA hydratase/carnithine racemase
MINHVLPAADLVRERSHGNKLAEAAPLAIAFTKATLNKTDMELDDVCQLKLHTNALFGTADCAEGIAAFKEKEFLNFTGNSSFLLAGIA